MNFTSKAVRTLTAAGLALVMCTGVAFASIGTATVTGDSLRLRGAAGTDAAILDTAAKGAQVDVLENAGDGWYKVAYNGTEGYMAGQWLQITLADGTTLADETVPLAAEPASQQLRGLITADVLNIRSAPDASSDKTGSIRGGMVVEILADTGSGWYQVSSGYISAEYVTLVDADYQAGSALGASAAAMAAQLLGCRYVSGGAGPSSFDCSGLMYYIYKQLGHPIARGSSSQYYKSGYFVPFNEMQPGDLIFFFDRRFDSSGGTLPTTHVGMYVGGDQFIHASTTSYRVQYDSIYGYYNPYIVAAKRIG